MNNNKTPAKDTQILVAKTLIENASLTITIDTDIAEFAQILLGGSNVIGLSALQGAVKSAFSDMTVKVALINRIVRNFKVGFDEPEKMNF